MSALRAPSLPHSLVITRSIPHTIEFRRLQYPGYIPSDEGENYHT